MTFLLEVDGIVTDCSLKTQDAEELLDFNMDDQSVLNNIVMSTDLLRDVMAEVDQTSEEMQVFVTTMFLEFGYYLNYFSTFQLFLSPSAPYFKISTDSVAGECIIEVPRDNAMISKFDCKKSATCNYIFSHIKPVMKAFSCSNKVSLRTDNNGLLCFQYMVMYDVHMCYIEYYVRLRTVS